MLIEFDVKNYFELFTHVKSLCPHDSSKVKSCSAEG